MMYGVFSGWYRGAADDAAIYDFARRQPACLPATFRTPRTNCSTTVTGHGDNTGFRGRKIYWGQGQRLGGCRAAADYRQLRRGGSEERCEAIRILTETSHALLPYQRADGFHETVFNRPGQTYIESSATTLIASGWMQGRCRRLPGSTIPGAGRAGFPRGGGFA